MLNEGLAKYVIQKQLIAILIKESLSIVGLAAFCANSFLKFVTIKYAESQQRMNWTLPLMQADELDPQSTQL